MFEIEKRFIVPIGHRLYKNKHLCKNIHGHNFTVFVGIKSKKLNEDDMVMDFSDLKAMVSPLLNSYDHCLLLNENDEELAEQAGRFCENVITFPFDPTAERLAQTVFVFVDEQLKSSEIVVDYVTVYENENSKATYRR
jgi:6-pyruvoyltetrahydropterin/6-carboxytetrahydropterin synthase